MDNYSNNNPAGSLDEAEEDILTPTVPDDVVEAAARAEKERLTYGCSMGSTSSFNCC